MQEAATKAKANEEVMRQVEAAFLAGDMAKFGEYLSQDIVWAMPGRGVLAGEYRGPDAVFGFLGRVMELTGGTFRPNVSHIISDGDGAAYVTHDTAERNGKRLAAALVLHVTIPDGKWTEVREYIHDLYAWDEFWS